MSALSIENTVAQEALELTRGIEVTKVDGRFYVGLKLGKETVTLTPAAARMAAKLPAGDRAATIKAAELIRKDSGHPTNADSKAPTAIWDHHLAAAAGSELSVEALAAFRKSLGLRRPSRA